MLLHELGYRAATQEELTRALKRIEIAPPDLARKDFEIPATVLSATPLISYSGIVRNAPLGVASIAAKSLQSQPAWFLLSPTWSIQNDGAAEKIRSQAVLHRANCPRHSLIFVCNTPEEVDVVRRYDEAAFYYNKTANTLEGIFRPLPEAEVEFDAIYNARLVPWKRHELSLAIETCAFLYYRTFEDDNPAQSEAKIIAHHRANAPGHVFINASDARGAPIRLSQSAVNEHLNRASVGLCLSEMEGAMYASTEYLLSGLPVVTTRSRGGRDVYYDEDYCLTVPPDPRSVAEAVRALKAKRIPSSYIRAKTMERIEKDRSRFLALINEILIKEQSDMRFAMPWPFKTKMPMRDWLSPSDAADRAASGFVDAFSNRSTRYFRRRRWWRKLTGF